MPAKHRFFFFLLIFFLILILFVEISLRCLLPRNRFYLWPPYRKIIFKPHPGVMPGVNGYSLFESNSQGVRADELMNNEKFRILAVGGSTTECLYIDQKKTWPYLLQENLKAGYKEKVWVGNIGRSGLSTTANLIELKYLLPQYEKIDLIIALVGFNDLQSALLNLYVKNSLKSDEEKISMTFSLHPLKEKDLFGRCELVNLFKKIRARCLRKDNEFLEDSAGGWYIGARNARKNAAQIIDALADMDKNLVVFEKNIKEIISLAELKGIRLIFLTQPSLWKNGLTNSEKDLLWFGYTQDKRKYYSIGALMKGLGQFNGRLKKICKEKNIECIELDTLLPKDTSVFYDDAHFNESGCRKIADILSEYLKENIKPRIKF